MLRGQFYQIAVEPIAQAVGGFKGVEDIRKDGFGSSGKQGFEHGTFTQTSSDQGDYSIIKVGMHICDVHDLESPVTCSTHPFLVQ
jgi:hypothetical protein